MHYFINKDYVLPFMLLSNESADDKWLMFDLLKSLHVLVFFYFLQIEMFQKF